jgi:peptide-N4-(N-acetyl-beta-glucosaminyl)asparagine amidase
MQRRYHQPRSIRQPQPHRAQGGTLPCPSCGGTAESSGMVEARPDEAAHGAGRVEAFACPGCGLALRFPRYTDPKKLLVTRKGR